MTVLRANVEFAKKIFYDRLGDPYVYGGTFDPNNVRTGADCSGLVTDILGALFFGPAMKWDREGLSTESYRYKPYGVQQVGPFSLVHVAHWQDIPADAVAKVSLHHGGSGGPDSHMNVCVEGIYMEESGSHGCCTNGQAIPIDNTYWNDHWYVPGPVVEDATPRVTPSAPTDTLFADVSEFQVPVNDSYPYQVLSIRVCDGTYQDHNFAENYAWMKRALDGGKLALGIVYTYVRPNWQATANTVRNMFGDNGGLHPKVVLMLDVESGGNPAGDGSVWVNHLYDNLVDFTGDRRRVIGYGNTGDLNSLWVTKPTGERLIVAGYGSNPSYPGKIAHQYTDGRGFGGGLPEGCPPFGNCDMNSADGLSPAQFAAICGIDSSKDEGFLMALTDAQQQTIYDKITTVWDSRSPLRHVGEGPVDDTVGFLLNEDGNLHVVTTILLALVGDPGALALLSEVSNADLSKYPDRAADKVLAQRIVKFAVAVAKVLAVPAVPVAPEAPVAAPAGKDTAPTTPVAPAPAEVPGSPIIKALATVEAFLGGNK